MHLVAPQDFVALSLPEIKPLSICTVNVHIQYKEPQNIAALQNRTHYFDSIITLQRKHVSSCILGSENIFKKNVKENNSFVKFVAIMLDRRMYNGLLYTVRVI